MSATLSSDAVVTARGETPVGLASATKRFGGTVALRDVTFDLVRATCWPCSARTAPARAPASSCWRACYRPDTGAVLIDGAPVEHWSPLDAPRAASRSCTSIPACSATSASSRTSSWATCRAVGSAASTDAPHARPGRRPARRRRPRLRARPDCWALRTSEQQLVEIARALSVDARVLIMDEPTAALSQREVERLFARRRRAEGARSVAMMFVGHRMEEIYRVADRIAVLRDGRLIGAYPAGRARPRPGRADDGRPAARAPSIRNGHRRRRRGRSRSKGLSRTGAFEDVSFTVRAGEIVGLGGLVGSGRTEVARVLFGIDRPTPGSIRRRRRAGRLRRPDRGHGGGHRLCLGRPAGPEPRHGFPDPRQCLAAGDRQGDVAGLVMRRSELAWSSRISIA